MASEIIVTLRIKPWWLTLLRAACVLRLINVVIFLAQHPAIEVKA